MIQAEGEGLIERGNWKMGSLGTLDGPAISHDLRLSPALLCPVLSPMYLPSFRSKAYAGISSSSKKYLLTSYHKPVIFLHLGDRYGDEQKTCGLCSHTANLGRWDKETTQEIKEFQVMVSAPNPVKQENGTEEGSLESTGGHLHFHMLSPLKLTSQGSGKGCFYWWGNWNPERRRIHLVSVSKCQRQMTSLHAKKSKILRKNN